MKIEDQPPPHETARRPAWELVIEDASRAFTDRIGRINQGVLRLMIEDMRERDQTGRARYGVPLTAGNGRNQLIDAYQEGLDFAVYLRAWIDERGCASAAQIPEEEMIRRVYREHLMRMFDLRLALASAMLEGT